jgi:hypothetical protein
LSDEQLRFFPRHLVSVDLSNCAAFTAHRLSKLLARCSQLQFLALNNCPAASALFSSEQLLAAACGGLQVPQSILFPVTPAPLLTALRPQFLSHLELAENANLDGNVSRRHGLHVWQASCSDPVDVAAAAAAASAAAACCVMHDRCCCDACLSCQH